jgi:antirestriction protein ArdC
VRPNLFKRVSQLLFPATRNCPDEFIRHFFQSPTATADTRLLVVAQPTQRQGANVMQTQNEIREQITNQLIDAIKAGTIPWRRPWSSDSNAPGLHTSMSTGSPYRGINQLILMASTARQNFKSKWWGTFNQIKQNRSSVSRGQKGTQIVLFKKIERERTDEAGDDVKDGFFVMKTFTVFNAEQTNGLEQFRVGFAKPQNNSVERHENADAVIDATGADIRYGGNEAFYNPPGGFVCLPHRHQFVTPESFYETAFHELTHWSEHPSRLNWDRANEGYAKGELIAEIGSCLMMGELGLPITTDLHAAYLKHWLDGMAGDSKFIFQAASQASKAVDFLLSFSRTTAATSETVEVEEPVLV